MADMNDFNRLLDVVRLIVDKKRAVSEFADAGSFLDEGTHTRETGQEFDVFG